MPNIAAIVILYYTDEQVSERIFTYLPAIPKLYIIDNSEKSLPVLQKLTSSEKIRFIHDGENKGIAKRLNDVIEIAISEGYEWLMTMDQDSFFEEEHLPAYFSCIEKFEGNNQVGMFGVDFEGTANIAADCTWQEITHLITSGSVVNLGLFNAIGKFDELLFIDEVDHEYCLRAIVKGYKIIK